ncbi:MAG: NUDIX hydrolase [Acidobacteriota bacterium]
MAEVEAVPAASVIVLRPGSIGTPFEVLMIRRTEQASFVPNAWVFPGGMVETLDYEIGGGALSGAMPVAGVRELFEETGVWLGAPLADAEHKRRQLLAGVVSFRHVLHEAEVDFERLVWTSHWITPFGVPKRFDTWFFLALAGPDTTATAEQNEAVDAVWIAPEQALERYRRGEWKMVFPTVRNLEAICGFESAEALLESRRGATIEAIQPVIVDGRIELP